MATKPANSKKIYDCIITNPTYFADNVLRATENEIGYKVCYYRNQDGVAVPVIIKLQILKNAWRTVYGNPFLELYSKHRCDIAKVIEFISYYTGKPMAFEGPAFSFHDPEFSYLKGIIVHPYWRFDFSSTVCGSGIHYFKHKKSALIYADVLCRTRHNAKIRKNAYKPKEALF